MPREDRLAMIVMFSIPATLLTLLLIVSFVALTHS